MSKGPRTESPRRAALAAALETVAPRAPAAHRAMILDAAEASRGLRTAAPEKAAWLACLAHIRHRLTDYDQLLAEGYGPEAARHFVLSEMNAVLADWGARRRIAAAADESDDMPDAD